MANRIPIPKGYTLKENESDIFALAGVKLEEQTPRVLSTSTDESGNETKVYGYTVPSNRELLFTIQNRQSLQRKYLEYFKQKYQDDPHYGKIFEKLVDQAINSDLNNDGTITVSEAANYALAFRNKGLEVYNALEVIHYGSLVTSMTKGLEVFSTPENSEIYLDRLRVILIAAILNEQSQNPHTTSSGANSGEFNVLGFTVKPTEMDGKINPEKAANQVIEELKEELKTVSGLDDVSDEDIQAIDFKKWELVFSTVRETKIRESQEGQLEVSFSGKAPLTRSEITQAERELRDLQDSGENQNSIRYSLISTKSNDPKVKACLSNRTSLFDQHFKRNFSDQAQLLKEFGDQALAHQAECGNQVKIPHLLRSLDNVNNPDQPIMGKSEMNLSANDRRVIREFIEGKLSNIDQFELEYCRTSPAGFYRDMCDQAAFSLREIVEHPVMAGLMIAGVISGIVAANIIAKKRIKRTLLARGCNHEQVKNGLEAFKKWASENLITKVFEQTRYDILVSTSFFVSEAYKRGTSSGDRIGTLNMGLLGIYLASKVILPSFFLKKEALLKDICQPSPMDGAHAEAFASAMAEPEEAQAAESSTERVSYPGPVASFPAGYIPDSGISLPNMSAPGSHVVGPVSVAATLALAASAVNQSPVPSPVPHASGTAPKMPTSSPRSGHITPRTATSVHGGSTPKPQAAPKPKASINPGTTASTSSRTLSGLMRVGSRFLMAFTAMSAADKLYAKTLGPYRTAIALHILAILQKDSSWGDFVIDLTAPMTMAWKLGEKYPALFSQAVTNYRDGVDQGIEFFRETQIMISKEGFPSSDGTRWLTGEEAHLAYLDMLIRSDYSPSSDIQKQLANFDPENNPEDKEKLKSNPELAYAYFARHAQNSLHHFQGVRESGMGFPDNLRRLSSAITSNDGTLPLEKGWFSDNDALQTWFRWAAPHLSSDERKEIISKLIKISQRRLDQRTAEIAKGYTAWEY